MALPKLRFLSQPPYGVISIARLCISLRKRWPEWSAALGAILIAAIHYDHPELIETDFYRPIAWIGPYFIPVFCALAGAARMIFIYINGLWWGSAWARVILSLLFNLIWGNMAWLFFLYPEILPGWPLAMMLLILECGIALFAWSEAQKRAEGTHG